jgi:putative ABC transport system permease protein
MSAIGVYGVMSDAVQRRTREIGLRLALGAGRRHVARLVFMNAAYLAVVGLSIGTAAAVAMTRVSRSIVDGVPSLDVTTLGGAAAILGVATAIAAVAPLVRAFRVNPNVALRVT